MNTQEMSRFDEEFGKAVCDRLGLPHNSTLREWSAESSGRQVWVSMTVMQAIPLAEFNEIRIVAAARADS